MIARALSIAALASLLGCGATVAAPPTVSLSPPPPPQVAAPEDGDVPFKGVFKRYAKLTYAEGRRIVTVNMNGEATLRIEPGKVIYHQSYPARGKQERVVQTYVFGTADVRSKGEDAFDITMSHRRMEGDPGTYAPDKIDVRLAARRRGWGWEIVLATTDTKGRRGGAAFAVEGAAPERPDFGLLREAIGYPSAPPDVAAIPQDAQITPSGLGSKVLAPGTGNIHPGPSDTVQVHYSGWTKDGTLFDSSVIRGQPASLRLNAMIKGWTEGVGLMVKGETRRLWIPSQLAYGDKPSGDAPAGDLVFDIELLDITVMPPAPAVPPDVKRPPPNAKRTASGLAYRVLKQGTGNRSPKASDTVKVHYSGWTTDGKMFDSSVTRGTPATFKLVHVIKGWTEGVQLMKVGETARFWMPAKLAYGDNPRPGAPAGMLVFDIELIAIE